MSRHDTRALSISSFSCKKENKHVPCIRLERAGAPPPAVRAQLLLNRRCARRPPLIDGDSSNPVSIPSSPPLTPRRRRHISTPAPAALQRRLHFSTLCFVRSSSPWISALTWGHRQPPSLDPGNPCTNLCFFLVQASLWTLPFPFWASRPHFSWAVKHCVTHLV